MGSLLGENKHFLQPLGELGYELTVNQLRHRFHLAYNYSYGLTGNTRSEEAPWQSFGSLAAPGIIPRSHLWDSMGQRAFPAWVR